MNRIPIDFTKRGFHYHLVTREGQYAIFERKMPHHTNPGYDVMEIQWHNGFTLHGKVVPPSEYLPSSEQWGISAFAFSGSPNPEDDLRRARRKFQTLIDQTEHTS